MTPGPRRPHADVAVVGLGAAGGIAAAVLARAGLRVVALEAGPRRRRGDFAFDEIRNDIRNTLGDVKCNHEIPTWRPRPEGEATADLTGRLTGLMVNGVGGGTIHYAGQHFRLAPSDFRLRSDSERRYGPTAIPAQSTAADWPIDYEELEPYYDAVEWELGVSGAGGANPFAGARSRGYPLPPLRRTGWTELVAAAARRLGLHPFPGPAAIRSEEYRGLAACTYCGFCNFNGCHTGAKGSTDVALIPEAEATGNLEVVAGARVLEITTDGDGRSAGVVFRAEGRDHFQPSSVVFLSAHTLENTRLLLVSRSSAFPDGLSNRHDQVGRNAMTHMYVGVDGVFTGSRLNRFGGTYSQCTSLDDFNGDNFDHAGLGFVGGACISAIQEAKPIATASSTPPTVPRWGSAWKAWLAEHGNSVGRAMATAESLPYEDTLIDLDPAATDRDGVRVLRMTYRLHEQEERRFDFLAARMSELLLEAGASETWISYPRLPAAPFQSVFGATRMGDDPGTSVVDHWCLSHEVPNLAVAGAGCFPTSSGYNPTATIQALAWRTADHLVRQWSSIVGR